MAVREPNYSQMAAEAQQPPSLAGIDLTTPAVIASDTESEPQTQSKECTASNAAGFNINLSDKPALHGAIAAAWEIGIEARVIRLSADGEWVKLQVDTTAGWTALSLVGLDCDPADLPIGN